MRSEEILGGRLIEVEVQSTSPLHLTQGALTVAPFLPAFWQQL